ncbi:MAG: acyl-CoA dehydrogenase family protein, partial [Myxococcota bacterium]
MDFRPSAEQARLRERIRAFLDADPAPAGRPFAEDGWIAGFDPAFSRRLGEAGFIGLTWPRRYGGAERSYLERLIVTEELLLAGAPVAAHWFGDRQIGPALLAHGSEFQRQALLPRITRGDLTFCVGMSEPDAGSDLANLKTRAIERDGEFVIRGQKIWTSFGRDAEFCYLVARTDPEARPHRGISEILVPMDAPGITVRPIIDMVGEEHFCEVFFEDVRVEARWLIGERNRGWYQIMQQLDYERSGIERLISNFPLWRAALEVARQSGASADLRLRQRIAGIETGLRAGRWMVYKVAEVLSSGAIPNREASAAKAFCTALEQQIADVSSQLLGPGQTLQAGVVPGRWGNDNPM